MESAFVACRRAVDRLIAESPVPNLDALNPNTAERDFEVLARTVRESIEKNEPESGLDRLHTFLVRYLRVVCEAHGISVTKEKPLHSLVGEYVKFLKDAGFLESDMGERILKSTISTLEAFNRVRNDQSFAHDNRVLDYDESILIFNHVAATVRFIDAVERRAAAKLSSQVSSAHDSRFK